MQSFIEKHGQNALIATFVGCVLSAVASLGGAYLTYHYATVSQDRQTRIEQISKFDTEGKSLLEATGALITAINANKAIDEARIKVRAAVASQLQDSEVLKKAFDGRIAPLVEQYQESLTDFYKIADKTSSTTEMRPWVESFGRVIDTRIALSKGLSASIGQIGKKGT